MPRPLSVRELFDVLDHSVEAGREALGALHALVPLEPWIFDENHIPGELRKITAPGSGELVKTSAGMQIPAWRAPAFPVTGEIQRIGRSWRNDLIIEQPTVSGVHAEISRTGGVFRVSDPGSRNGTTVNGKLLSLNSLTRLDDGDVLVFGEAAMIFGGLDHLGALLRRTRVAKQVTRRVQSE